MCLPEAQCATDSRDALNPEPVAERRERADDIVVERHMSERRLVFRCEIEMGQAHGVAHVPVHDRHRQDRLGLRLDRLPGADLFEQTPRPIGDRDRAQRACAGPAGGPGSTTATDAPCPIACLIAAASANPDAPPPAMTTSKMGAGSAMRTPPSSAHCRTDESRYPLLGRGAISESAIPSFQGLAARFASRPAPKPCGRLVSTGAGRALRTCFWVIGAQLVVFGSYWTSSRYNRLYDKLFMDSTNLLNASDRRAARIPIDVIGSG